MRGVRPNLTILVVYKTKEGNWRGFCYPYDVTCEAKSENVAMKRLKGLVEFYKERLEKYEYPKHLSIRPLSDKDDRRIFKIVIKIVEKKIIEEIKKDLLKQQWERRLREEFRVKRPTPLSGHYYLRSLITV